MEVTELLGISESEKEAFFEFLNQMGKTPDHIRQDESSLMTFLKEKKEPMAYCIFLCKMTENILLKSMRATNLLKENQSYWESYKNRSKTEQ